MTTNALMNRTTSIICWLLKTVLRKREIKLRKRNIKKMGYERRQGYKEILFFLRDWTRNLSEKTGSPEHRNWRRVYTSLLSTTIKREKCFLPR